MKKIFVAKLALAGVVGVAAALASGTAGAADCSACHTMHNSQGGNPMRFDSGVTPLPILLRDDCIGCHSGLNTAASLLTSPPRVIGTAAPTYTPVTGGAGAANTTLAGGDFWWVNNGSDAKGHNVVLVSAADATLSTPPGGSAPAQVACAGTSGCHGNPATANALASLEGAHHALHGNGFAQTTATTVGNSFRYLLGTYGAEDSDWQFTESTTDHNKYIGLQRTAANATADPSTISGLCARCHGAYHNTVGGDDAFGINEDNTNFANGNWIRHPTDYAMPNAGEYAGYTTYQPETPVGRIAANIAVAGDNVGAGNRIVLCVSCHRAHGSPYDDALRWTYSAMQVGAGVTHGCMNCHTAK
ncbi:MAG: cytochrome c3 family protein [Desulfobulbaceae bacterium]